MTLGDASPWSWTPPGERRLSRSISLFRFHGPDALRVLHGQTSQALQDSRPGEWRSTCCLTPTARVRGLAEVIVEDDGAWLALTAGDATQLWTAFDRVLFPADQVKLSALQPGLWIRVLGLEPSPSGSWRPIEGGGGWCLDNNLVLFGETPIPAPFAEVPSLSPQEAAFWRLQQGELAWPEEINDAFNPFELGLADRVSLDKGCYVGQETLAKLASSDGVKQQLRRWYVAPTGIRSDSVAAGLPLRTAQGDRAGQITSSMRLADGSWVGLAMVRRQCLDFPTLVTLADDSPLTLSLSRPAAFTDPPTTQGSETSGRTRLF